MQIGKIGVNLAFLPGFSDGAGADAGDAGASAGTGDEGRGPGQERDVWGRGVLQTKVVAPPAGSKSEDWGKTLTVQDQYWYSEELHLNMLMKHDDPRTGSQIVSVTQVTRTEPDAKLFEVPVGYKLVDESPE